MTGLLIGEFVMLLDGRRVTIPQEFRKIMGLVGDGDCVLANGVLEDECASLWTVEKWDSVVERRRQSILEDDPGCVDLGRLKAICQLGTPWTKVRVSEKGQITLPKDFRVSSPKERGKEKPEVTTFVGCGHFIQLWKPEVWDLQRKSLWPSFWEAIQNHSK